MSNPLHDKDINGNVSAWMANQERERAASHKDQYRCPCCQELVFEYEWIDEMKVCRFCWEEKHGSGYVGIDQARYLGGL